MSTSTQNNNSGSNPAPTPQPEPPATNPPAPQTFSGTWFQEDDPQILIQWTLSPAEPSPGAPPPEPGPAGSSYQAQVRIYQQIFDAQFPNPPLRGPVVPFSVLDPTVGSTPFLQGSLVLTQAPTLDVINLRFPGFPAQNLALFPSPPADPPTADNKAPEAESASGADQPAAAGAAADAT